MPDTYRITCSAGGLQSLSLEQVVVIMEAQHSGRDETVVTVQGGELDSRRAPCIAELAPELLDLFRLPLQHCGIRQDLWSANAAVSAVYKCWHPLQPRDDR